MATPTPPQPKEAAVLEALLTYGPTSRAGIARYLGRNRGDVGKQVVKLAESGLVATPDPETVTLGPGLGLVAAAAIGGGLVRAGIVDSEGVVHHPVREWAADQLADEPERALKRLSTALAKTVSEASADPALLVRDRLPLLGVTCAVPAAISRAGYLAGQSLAHPDWHSGPFTARLRRALTIQLKSVSFVDALNNANADLIGVAYDAARTQANADQTDEAPHSNILIAVRVSYGIGAGMIHLPKHEPNKPSAFSRSRLLVGSNGYAGELGHVRFDVSVRNDINKQIPRGPHRCEPVACSCGHTAHLESVVSVRAVKKRLGGRTPAHADPDALAAAFTHPDEPTRQVLQDAGRLLGRALDGTILMLDPRSVTLTGLLGVEAFKDGMVQEKHSWSRGLRNDVEIIPLSLAERTFSSVRGAGLAMLRRHVFRDLAATIRQPKVTMLRPTELRPRP